MKKRDKGTGLKAIAQISRMLDDFVTNLQAENLAPGAALNRNFPAHIDEEHRYTSLFHAPLLTPVLF